MANKTKYSSEFTMHRGRDWTPEIIKRIKKEMMIEIIKEAKSEDLEKLFPIKSRIVDGGHERLSLEIEL